MSAGDAAPELVLGGEAAAFARGGNRLCFVDPRNASRCIKVARADRSPALKRRQSGFPKRFKPLAAFDDNCQEERVYARIARAVGDPAFGLIPRLYGRVRTDLGPGLCFDLLRDDDGRISITLKQYLWQHGLDAALEAALDRFGERWAALGMPSRRLLTHNLVLQCEGGNPRRLWAIDGLGWPDFVPLARYWPALARRKAARRVAALQVEIAAQLERRGDPSRFGYHGWLEEDRRRI